ncbi:flagellin [Youhaiella tibetensis]|uniref:Flagellin n=1 Tax=Paradevosia tibetensis TaxID=1447062 RepID=A0A5B9DSD5_9HYPH|nr:flagellin [Youhaiella tibetensis]QEE21264.1 hypothetical protein FNA67_14210 [Youhaiella tibetensis]GGF16495.1 flagellin [Youhaiella tibetensis]
MSDITLTKSVRTNLLSLQNTASLMAKTQERLATGKKVNSALDNPTNFFTASALNSRASDMSSLMDSMANGVKTIEAANNGITSITKTVESMQSTLRQARQDKSFQTGTYSVTADSTLSVTGGQFGATPQTIKLQTSEAGINAEVKSSAATAYLGPQSTDASATGAGARSLITRTGLAGGDSITVGGVAVALVGADVASDAALATKIQTTLDGSAEAGKYTVTAGTGANAGKVIVEAVDTSAASPTVDVSGSSQVDVLGTTTFNWTDVSGAITVGGQTVNSGATAEDFLASLQASAEAGGYTVDYDSGTGAFTLTNVASGATSPTVTGIPAAVTTNGTVGTKVEAVAAEKDEFTVTFDGKSADISISGVKGGIGSVANALDKKNWQDATIAQVNAQLKAGGLDSALEAKFDADGKFSIVAKTAEAKTIAITGTDAVSTFGSSAVSTGKAEVKPYSSTGAVDQFVEEINRSFAGQLRASNDNGKLRVENLSTQELDVSFDEDGAGVGPAVASKIAGNTVRDNLAKQFNELRDQLDKLADDASFNGINLLRGDQLTITFNENGSSSIKIQAKDANGNERAITAANLSINYLEGTDLDTDSGIDSLLGKLSESLSTLRSQASTFGSNLSSVENRQDFTKNMINTLQSGADNLTLADMNEEAANLLALQTRQSLSSSALSMASQADQSVLQLLR